ncbi:MAG: large conductance mechanosensitive channel protein MscL [Spirochaetia bacterium]|nr:large conductance mechanosensitive channel protein MscL [Spirochaetia bacterium]
MSFIKDFKAFIARGNVMDMAVGVVVGGAFGKIVSSLVADLVTPLISLATKGVNLKEAYICVNPAAIPGQEFSHAAYPTIQAAQDAGYATLNYGNFIQNIIDFLIIALCVFAVIRVLAKSKEAVDNLKKKNDAETAEAAKTDK